MNFSGCKHAGNIWYDLKPSLNKVESGISDIFYAEKIHILSLNDFIHPCRNA